MGWLSSSRSSPFRSLSSLGRRSGAGVLVCAAVAALTGCYVAPIQPAPVVVHAPAAVAPPAPVTLSVRLYPANEQASALGVVHAVVTNDLHGRGTFQANIQGENFVGEATRKAGSSREGLANGAGTRGGYLSCQYSMNSPSLGTGSCRLSSGALFTMHVGG